MNKNNPYLKECANCGAWMPVRQMLWAKKAKEHVCSGRCRSILNGSHVASAGEPKGFVQTKYAIPMLRVVK